MRTRLDSLCFSLSLPSALVLLLAPSEARAAEVPVSTAAELQAAISDAAPGDEIILAPGIYAIPSKLSCTADGTAEAPIVVRAEALGEAVVEMDNAEGFHIQGAHWQVTQLEIVGVCADDSACEHAFHITGDAEGTYIHHNRVEGFNAHIKANGTNTGPMGERVWPDDVVIEYNEFFNPAPRQTSNPVTLIDVVGGRRWLVRANYIHDFAKGQGNNISYAAFLKGNSRDGVFERNLVVCEWLHSGGVRLGLSFGGGGSSPDSICEDGSCTPEHQDGIMRNNIIAHCPADVGIYVNEGANTLIYNNTLYDTTGIDMRFEATTGEVRNNILDGEVRNRDASTANFASNLEMVPLVDLQAWFVDPEALDFSLADGAALVDQGENLGEVIDDYCANIRDDGTHDLGALEYDGDGMCDSSVPFEPEEGETDTGEEEGETSDTGDEGGSDAGDEGSSEGPGEGDSGDESASSEDAGTGEDDVGESGPGADEVGEDGGCSCSSATGRERGRGPRGLGGLALAVMVALGAGRRRRGRGSSVEKPM